MRASKQELVNGHETSLLSAMFAFLLSRISELTQ
jgi:hypothetical protein